MGSSVACRYTASRIAEVAQLVEHRSEKPGVDSSILSLGTTIAHSKPDLARGEATARRPTAVGLEVLPTPRTPAEPLLRELYASTFLHEQLLLAAKLAVLRGADGPGNPADLRAASGGGCGRRIGVRVPSHHRALGRSKDWATAVKERTLCPVVVGRELELAALEDALIDAARADGRFVVICGDAGLGETQLPRSRRGVCGEARPPRRFAVAVRRRTSRSRICPCSKRRARRARPR